MAIARRAYQDMFILEGRHVLFVARLRWFNLPFSSKSWGTCLGCLRGCSEVCLVDCDDHWAQLLRLRPVGDFGALATPSNFTQILTGMDRTAMTCKQRENYAEGLEEADT